MAGDDQFVWFETDTLKELTEAVEFAKSHIAKLPDDHSSIKWSIMGSILALQSACIYQLDGHDTSRTAVLGKNSRKQMLEYLNGDRTEKCPVEWLASPKELLNRVLNPSELPHAFSKDWDDVDTKNAERLVDLRNDFIHFLPQSWSIELSGFPHLLQSNWKIVSTLVFADIPNSHRFSEEDMSRLRDSVKDVVGDIEPMISES